MLNECEPSQFAVVQLLCFCRSLLPSSSCHSAPLCGRIGFSVHINQNATFYISSWYDTCQAMGPRSVYHSTSPPPLHACNGHQWGAGRASEYRKLGTPATKCKCFVIYWPGRFARMARIQVHTSLDSQRYRMWRYWQPANCVRIWPPLYSIHYRNVSWLTKPQRKNHKGRTIS